MKNVVSIPDHLLTEFAVASMLTAGLCGAALVAWLWNQRGGGARAWAVVKGSVVESTVLVEQGPRWQVYRPLVRYSYEVGGERFKGQRISWSPLTHQRKFTCARQVLDNYRPGTAVSVYYDLERPSQAILHPCRNIRVQPTLVIGTASALYVLFIIGPLFFGR